MPTLIFLHGFNSSPESWKAQAIAEYIRRKQLSIDYRIPRLPWEPVRAAEMLRELMASLGKSAPVLIGSSLGGFYATWLAEVYGLQAALINPAVRPYALLTRYLGDNANLHTDEHYELKSEHVAQLLDLKVDIRHPERFMYLVQSGDETLDFREAVQKYAACTGIIQPGGSHGYDDFETRIPAIFSFLGLPFG